MTYFPLEPLQKLRRRDAVQLSVVELEGHRQGGPQPLFPVLAPDEEGVVVASGVDVHRAVDLVPRQGGGSDDHVVLAQFIALSALPDLPGERPVVPVKLLQVVGDGDVTGGDTAVPGGYHRIDGQAVILHQLVAHRKQVEVLHPGRRLSDAPAEEHIEFAAPLPAPAHQCRHIQGLHQDYRGGGAGFIHSSKASAREVLFGINFSHTLLHSARQIRFGRPGESVSYHNTAIERRQPLPMSQTQNLCYNNPKDTYTSAHHKEESPCARILEPSPGPIPSRSLSWLPTMRTVLPTP